MTTTLTPQQTPDIRKSHLATRQITLQEWQAKDLLLSQAEVGLLMQCAPKLCQLQPLAHNYTRVTPGSFVGQVSLGNLNIRILPKYPMPSLLCMLAEVHELAELVAELAGYQTQSELVDLLVQIYLHQVDRVVRQGLRRTYIQQEDALVAVRGRIDPRRTTDLQLRGQARVQCRFEEYILDSVENRLLLAALKAIVRNTALSVLRRNLAYQLTSVFWGVQQLTPLQRKEQKHAYDRLNAHYHPALELAQLILTGSGILQEFGVAEANGFLMDMNRLFEKFVSRKLQKKLAPHNIHVREQQEFAFDLDRQSTIRPDLLFIRSTGSRLVADTKYKIGVDTGPGDLHQMLAYCHILKIQKGILIRIGTSQPRHFRVADRETIIQVVNVDLDGCVAEIERSLDELAGLIVREI